MALDHYKTKKGLGLKGPKNMLKGHKMYAVVFQVMCECKYTIALKYCDI